ncbi:universal stress protein [Halorubrum vacuolatum]|uniref:Nucleotide-binding universal stress protein, UspA family n=1 Tax=Halorubrum vacuolatum TaxID=63740 RepID=A0A238W8F4_HALVU|nr:universal stress protein [Halorubrum vacuolatum]SNR42830.1 Nucleotide-binding universal stress protein, UspA family [Halorubrum vacuolatum]
MSIETETDTETRDRSGAPRNSSAELVQSGATNPSTAKTGTDPGPTGLFGRVLVVTDGEATGRAAVDVGIDLASAHGATVEALYVVDTTEHWDMVVERRERAGEAAVEDAAARGHRAGVEVEKRFRYGIDHEEVLDFAATHDVDLIVVGSARRTGLDRLINPEPLPVRLQRGADVPVLVVGTDRN